MQTGKECLNPSLHCGSNGFCNPFCVQNGEWSHSVSGCCSGLAHCFGLLGCLCTWPCSDHPGDAETPGYNRAIEALLKLEGIPVDLDFTELEKGLPFVCDSEIMSYPGGRFGEGYACLCSSSHSCTVSAGVGVWVVDDGVEFTVAGLPNGYCCPPGTNCEGRLMPSLANCNDCARVCKVETGACSVDDDCCQTTDSPPYAFDQECSNLHCCEVGWSWSDTKGCVEAWCADVGGLRVPDSWASWLFQDYYPIGSPDGVIDQACCADSEEWEDIIVYS